MGNQVFSGKIREEILGNRKIANFHPKQIDYMREKFVLMCDDDLTVGKATFAELVKLEPQDANKIFEYFDMDSSGKIDSYEFICALALISHANLKEKAAAIFRLYDFDNSLILNSDEMVVLIRCCLCSLAALCGRQDIPSIQEVEELVTELLKGHDKDYDGQISLEEFQGIITKDKRVLNTLNGYGLLKSYDLRENFGVNGGESDEFQLPECDSDLELEENKGYDFDSDDELEQDSEIDQTDRIRQGIDFKIKQIGDEIFEFAEDEKGENWMANVSWKKMVKKGKPTDYIPGSDPKVGTVPEVDLSLEHIYGYRCHDTRNNTAYSPSGDLIYHTAAVGIVMNKKTRNQKFFFGHYDDITCLDVYDSLVATGQVGKIPSIHLWDSKSCKSKGVITSPLTRGISHVCFSENGKKLAAICIDRYHSVAVFDVQKILNSGGERYQHDVILAYSRGPRETVFHMIFSQDKRLAFGCKRGIYFGDIKDGKIKLKRGHNWGNTPRQAILCMTSFENQSVIAGSHSGMILKWKNNMLAETIKGHDSACTAICKRHGNKGLITGGSDGKIIFWSSQMSRISEIDLYTELAPEKRFKLNSIKVRSICEDRNKDITIGTRGGELLEYKQDGRFNIKMQGHYNKELWGVCNLRNGQEFATVGEDFLLNIYDISQRKVMSSTRLMFQGICIDSSPDGKRLAVGCKNGYVLVIDISTKQTVKTLKDREKEITCIKFSNEGKWLSVGGVDSEILNYAVKDNYALQSRFRGHHSRVLHFDFSKNSSIIQSMCSSYEILYSKVEDGKRIPSGISSYKDEDWSSWSLTIGWPTQGIWPPCSNGTDINAVARSTDQKLLATVDDYGLLKLFRFPSPFENSSYTKYIGHSSHVTNVIFSEQGNHILTTGGNDKSVMQWKLTIDNEQSNEGLMIDKDEEEEDVDELEFLKMIEEHKKSKIKKREGMFEYDDNEVGEQQPATKPYLGELKASIPTDFEPSLNHRMAPNQNLDLHHVYGFRSVGAKDNVKYTSDGKVIFISASLGVIMESKNSYQSFFSGHNDDVVSLAIHPKKKIAATGQVAYKGESKMIPIYVWDIETKEILATLKGFHRGCIKVLKFSPDGSKLLSIGTDKDNSIAIYDWARERLITQSKVSKSLVTDAAFKTDNIFVTVGIGHIKFWEQNETKLSFKGGRWGLNSRDPIICAIYCFPQSICFTGGKSGRIHTWRGETCSSEKQAHSGVVRVLVKHKHILYSGGDDGLVIVWSYSGKLQNQRESLVNMANVSSFKPGIRSIDIKKDNTILVATRGSDIYEIGMDDDQTTRLLLSGHFSRRIMGLAVHPKTAKFATCGEDRTIRIWDGKSKNMNTFRELDEVPTAIDWSSDGQFLAVSLKSGNILLLGIDLQELDRLLSTFTNKNNEICVLKISPDCSKLAIGSHGSTYIEIHNISNNKLVSNGLIKGMTSVVNFIDWSVESNLIMANSQAYELKFFSITTMNQIKSSSVRDQKWYTWTCAIGWPTQGILSGSDGTEINTVCRAQNQDVVATGEDSSLVKLFRYPNTSKKCGFKAYKGHSSHVNQIRFIGNDEFLVSTGSLDRTVIVWKTDFGNFEGLEEDKDYLNIEEDIDPIDIANTDPQEEDKKELEIMAKNQGEDLNKEEELQFGNDDTKNFDQFGLMIKPWQVTAKPPRKFLKPPVDYDKKPRVKVSLHHVFGYHSKNVRNNAKLVNDEVIFFNGALAISQKIETNEQRYFDCHKNRITALTLNKDRNLVATGEFGFRPTVYIWDAETLIVLKKLSKGLRMGIKTLEFSPDSKMLLTICSDKYNTLVIFKVINGALITKVRTGTQRIMDSVWANKSAFVTIGINHFKRWNLKQGRLRDKLGMFNERCKVLICCALNSNQVLVGNIEGKLQVWKGHKLDKDVPVHDACIDSIKVTNNYILTGGKDHVIKVMTKNYAIVTEIKISKLIEELLNPRIRSLDVSSDSKQILIGTYSSEICLLDTSDPKINKMTKFNCRTLMQGHYFPSRSQKDKILGLVVMKDGDKFITVSDDATLRMWSTKNRNLERYLPLNRNEDDQFIEVDEKTGENKASVKLTAIDISSSEEFIVVGARDGTLKVIITKDLKLIHTLKTRNSKVNVIKFNPYNTLMAIGYDDSYIEVYLIPDFKRKYSQKKHVAPVIHFDWSRNSGESEKPNFLQSNCEGQELLYFDFNNGKHISDGGKELRDYKWNTWNCVYGWPVQGIWTSRMPKMNEINSVDRSNKKLFDEYHMLAVADQFKRIKIYKYPCLRKNSEGVVGKGHSSAVSNVKWSCDDQYIYTTGESDGMVMIWKVDIV